MYRIANGSFSNQRMQSAAVRCVDSWQRVIRRAEQISEEIDEVTIPGTAVPVDLHDEDSAVIVVASALDEHKKLSPS